MEQKNRISMVDRMHTQLVDAQPWIKFARSALEAKSWSPKPRESVIIGSDYSGQNKKSLYLTYAFVIASENTLAWDEARTHYRQHYIPDNRRLSFKRFGKSNNPMGLAHFLDITKLLDGHMIVFAFEKKLIRQLPWIQPKKEDFELTARWKPAALEEATRKSLLLALLVAHYVPPNYSMNWITDEDPSVGNNMMFTDVQRMAATLSGVLSTVQRGIFGMGTTGQDCKHMYREDYVAIADFAAGMIADVTTHLALQPVIGSLAHSGKYEKLENLSEKTQVIAEWFWRAGANFKRTCFIVDGTKERGRVVELFA